MPEMIYSFNGKDITMNVCIQIRDVLKLLQQHFHISFEEAALKFYKSETYKTLQETENGLWAESAEYIADRLYKLSVDVWTFDLKNRILCKGEELCQKDL